VLCEPAFVAGENRSYAQSEALFAEKGVSAVTRAVRPDFPCFGEVADVLVFNRGAGPFTVVVFTCGKGFADRVETRHIKAVFAEHVQNL